MGTHPIFESDFDCLTADSDTFLTMEWTQTEKAAEKQVAQVAAPAAAAPAQNQVAKKGDKKSVHISELSVQQLQNIGRQTQQEFNQLRQSMSGLKAAGTNFFGARQAVQSWKENMEMGDDKIFVPMTNSLLVPGKMAEGAMLVELGGGIMMEKSIEDTIKFMDRRMQMVTSSMNKCGSELQQKAMAGQAIEKEMESKMKEMNLYNKIYQ